MIKVLISHSLYPESFCGFPADFQVIKPQEGSFTYEELLEKIADVDAFIPTFDIILRFLPALISSAGTLKSNIGIKASTSAIFSRSSS